MATAEQPGVPGDSGVPSQPGESGVPGDSGDSGVPGQPGESGVPGDSGVPSQPGESGVSGVPGESGVSGVPGDSGEYRVPGVPGDSGVPSQPGESGVPGASGEHQLTPTQQRVLTDLMGQGQPRPVFDPELALRLRSDLEVALSEVADGVGHQPLIVHKNALSQVHTCEAHHLAEQDAGFAWSPATAMGAVAHKSIELSATMRHPPGPAELLELAIERLAADLDRGPGAWLAAASEVELAELRAGALDRLLKFGDEFPPIKLSWRPRLESLLRTSLCADRIVLQGRVDLALGRATGSRAGVLIVDFKTGRASRAAADDLRFYALLETLRCGVPPFRVASWFLDAGQYHAEDVDEPMLDAAARRVIDGTRTLYEVAVQRRPPAVEPGPACGYCSARAGCEGARRWAERREADGIDW